MSSFDDDRKIVLTPSIAPQQANNTGPIDEAKSDEKESLIKKQPPNPIILASQMKAKLIIMVVLSFLSLLI